MFSFIVHTKYNMLNMVKEIFSCNKKYIEKECFGDRQIIYEKKSD